MKKAAVLCAQGIGDGLLMMIAASNLKKEGYAVTVFHNTPDLLALLFGSTTFLPYPALEEWEAVLQEFDLVLVENDNSARVWHLFGLRDQKKLSQLTFLFPTPCIKYTSTDFLFDPKLPVASNIAEGCRQILKQKERSKDNGILLPKDKVHRRFPKRVVIHPTSNDPKRNWHPPQFIKLAKKLEKAGYSVSFSVGPHERSDWLFVEDLGYSLPKFQTLRDVADYLYESGFLIGNDSGIGHLASNLNIPTLTISGNPKRVRLWRPDWATGEVVTIPFPLPNFKGIHFTPRTHFWQHFIPVGRTLKAFQKLVERTS